MKFGEKRGEVIRMDTYNMIDFNEKKGFICDMDGFYTELDGGVPDKQDISFIGGQQVFDLAMAGCEVDSIALGACNCDY